MNVGTRVRDFITGKLGTVVQTEVDGRPHDAVRIEWDNAKGQETFWYTRNYFVSPKLFEVVEVLPRQAGESEYDFRMREHPADCMCPGKCYDGD